MLLGFYFFIVIGLPLALGGFVVFNGLPRSRQCPTCAGETIRLQSRAHGLASRAVRHAELQLRWCMRCGWRGAARVERETLVRPGRAGAASPTRPDRVDLRSLYVDGSPWRVMVECWAEEGQWVARLVFVDPAGQVWPDQRSIEGRSVLAVISQAFSLPERTLTGRLRRSVR